MVRYIAAAILGCLYAAGSYWVVRSQGEAYREGLRRERLATAAGTGAPMPRPLAEDLKTDSVSTPEPAPPRPGPRPARPGAAEFAVQPVKPAEAPTPPAAAVALRAEPGPSPPAPAGRVPGAVAANVPDPAAKSPKLDPVWDQPAIKKAWDLAHLTPRGEFRLGRELHELILMLNPPVKSGPWLARVEAAGEPFLESRSRRDIEYTYTVLDSDAVNAFSTPGGFIYVSRGLFNLIGEEEDSALEFAVGHEMAHVDLQHALKCLQDPEVMKLGEGTLQKLYGMIIPFAYLDAQEYEADRWVYRKMTQRGRTRREVLMFLRKLEGHSQAHGYQDGRVKPELKPNASPLENHLRAHTAARKRLKQLSELIAKAQVAPK